MPSMGVGTSDVPEALQFAPVSPSPSAPRLSRQQGAVRLQHWWRQQRLEQQSGRLLALLVLLRANDMPMTARCHDDGHKRDNAVTEASPLTSSSCSSAQPRPLPEVCRCLSLDWTLKSSNSLSPCSLVWLLLDAVEAYRDALGLENYTRRVLCEESLPASNHTWRTASPAIRQRLRQRHPLLRHVHFLPETSRSDVVVALQDHVDHALPDVEPSWEAVDMRMLCLLGRELVDWLWHACSVNATQAPVVHALTSWRRWRAGRVRVGTSLLPDSEAGLVEDVPPLPPPRALWSNGTSSGPVEDDGVPPCVAPAAPLPLAQTQKTTAAAQGDLDTDATVAALEVEDWLRDEAEPLGDVQGETLTEHLAEADKVALRRCNDEFFAAQERWRLDLRESLKRRLGMESDSAEKEMATRAVTSAGTDAEAEAADNPSFGKDVSLVMAPFLGCSRKETCCVCALCELKGVWLDSAAAPKQIDDADEEALVACGVCHAAVHVSCASRVGKGAAWACSSLCADRLSAQNV